MIHLPRAARTLLPALAAAAAIAAVTAPAASAADYPVLILNEQTGVLTYTADNHADFVTVTKEPSTTTPGAYDIKVFSDTSNGVGFSSNCDELGKPLEWVIRCPAAKVKSLAFAGGTNNDMWKNQTGLTSTAHGGGGNDRLYGGGATDTFYGDAGDDDMLGNGGNDTLDGGAGFDEFSGGGGVDTASWQDATGPVALRMDGAANDGVSGENESLPSDIENLQGGPYGDILQGNEFANQLRGGNGDDKLDGRNGDDLLNGQAGNDTLQNGQGADSLFGGTETDTLSYGGDPDRVTVLQDFVANDGMAGEHDNVNQVENIGGTEFSDELQGTDGNDTINGFGGRRPHHAEVRQRQGDSGRRERPHQRRTRPRPCGQLLPGRQRHRRRRGRHRHDRLLRPARRTS
jgi:Ca2+-binding RTX toxin-like protein